jgi:hypothetical protein
VFEATVRELVRELVVELRRASDAARRDRAIAYYVAHLSRREKLPSLEAWLTPARRSQTRAQQRSVIEQLSAQLGRPLERVRLVHREQGSPDGG